MTTLARPSAARLFLCAAALVLAAACGDSGGDGGAMDHDATPPADTVAPAGSATPATLLEPDAFAARIARPEALVVNVHIPYEGDIEGTDASIPFDRIVGDARLPAEKDAEIVLYCKSGRMSALAARDLAAEGYANLYDLEGGMNAWEAAGRPLVHRHAGDAGTVK